MSEDDIIDMFDNGFTINAIIDEVLCSGVTHSHDEANEIVIDTINTDRS